VFQPDVLREVDPLRLDCVGWRSLSLLVGSFDGTVRICVVRIFWIAAVWLLIDVTRRGHSVYRRDYDTVDLHYMRYSCMKLDAGGTGIFLSAAAFRRFPASIVVCAPSLLLSSR
jgi:hypothetical protein